MRDCQHDDEEAAAWLTQKQTSLNGVKICRPRGLGLARLGFGLPFFGLLFLYPTVDL